MRRLNLFVESLILTVLLGVVFCSLQIGSVQARPIPVFELEGSQLSITAVSTGSHKVIQVSVSNSDSVEHEVTFPYGTVFASQSTSYQSLALTKTHDSLVVPSGEVRTLRIKTACMHASRGVAPAGYSDWRFEENRGLKNLLTAYYTGSSFDAVKLLVKSEMLDTEEKKDAFLQAVVWIYFDATEDQMVAFASKYSLMPGGESETFIRTLYPQLKTALDLYKTLHGER